MQSVNECMKLMIKKNRATKEGIKEETQISVFMEEEYLEEKEVQEKDNNWKEHCIMKRNMCCKSNYIFTDIFIYDL